MAGPAVFFVPLAIAGGKVFFKFATKKAAEVFKKRFAKAGSVTTRTPPKNATVTTTGSNKGKSIIQDMTKPVTQPKISPRNPNTSTLPKAPAKGSGGAKAAGAAATGAGVAAGSTATGKDADKPKSSRSTSQGGRSRDQVIEQKQEALARKGGASLSRIKKKKTTSGQMTDAQRKSQGAGVAAKKKMATPTPPPKRPKKSSKVTKPTSKPKLVRTIDPKTGKVVDKKVTEAQHLANLDAAKKRGLRIGSQNTKADRAKARKKIEAMIKKAIKEKGKTNG